MERPPHGHALKRMAADRSRTQRRHNKPQDHSPSWAAEGERKKRGLWVICRRPRRSRDLAPERDFEFKGTGLLSPASGRGRCLSAAAAASRSRRRGARTSGEGRAIVCTRPHPGTQLGRPGLCGPGGGVGASGRGRRLFSGVIPPYTPPPLQSGSQAASLVVRRRAGPGPVCTERAGVRRPAWGGRVVPAERPPRRESTGSGRGGLLGARPGAGVVRRG